MVGEVIADRYEIVRVLGHGGGGAVFEVVDRSSGEPAALKTLVAEDPDLAARLVREGKALALVAHPHIVALVDAGETADGTPYVVTELLHGRSLRDLLDTDPALDPRRAIAIVRQVLEALDAVHGVGMVHRDIKPENVMLVRGGQPGHDYVRLLDFGAAKLLDPAAIGEAKLTRAGLEVLGSPPYIAPETAIGEPLDARTDLYSVGIVLYELLAGRVPFAHADTTTLLRMHVTDPPPPLAVAPALAAVVEKALAKVPDHRFASALDMHAALETAALALDTAQARPRPRSVISEPVAIVPDPSTLPRDRPVVSRSERSLPTAPPRGFPSRARELAGNLAASARRHPQRAAAIATLAVVVVLVLAFVIRSSSTAAVKGATTTAPTPMTETARARTFVSQGDTDLARQRYAGAVAAYERALLADRTLARDAKLRTAIAQLAARGDAVTATVALDLASRLEPPDTKTITDLAATAKLTAVRRRAFAIAERDGFAGSIDRLASWTLDLRQPASCDDRRETIAKLAMLGDKRAIDALQKARAQACVAKDAAAAIERLGGQVPTSGDKPGAPASPPRTSPTPKP
jgi:serine/threonine protein kinase